MVIAKLGRNPNQSRKTMLCVCGRLLHLSEFGAPEAPPPSPHE